MAGKIKYGKILVVVFLTILLWVWADMALDKELPDKPAVVVIDQSVNPKLWVSFGAESSTEADIKVTLSGPHTAIAILNRKLKEGEKIRFDFDAAQEKMEEPDSYPLNLLPFLQKDRVIKRLGLKVESCEPDKITVKVERLVEKKLAVRCVDGTMTPIKANVVPAKVNAFVPEDWVGSATVQLAQFEIDQAMSAPVFKRPYVELVSGQVRPLHETVKISTPPGKDQLEEYLLPGTLAIALSPNLIGKYNVEVKNLPDLISAIAIKATAEAKQAYGNMRYQVILEIDDEDKNVTAEQSRKVIYNFPEEYVRNSEIILNQTEAQARFNLTPISSPQTP